MRVRHLAAILLLLLVACEETQLEPTPEAITRREPDVCPGEHLAPGETVSGDWGSATGISNGVNYEVNAGWTVTVCSKGGADYNIATITGPDSGFLQTPPLENGNVPALSHFSITDPTPEPSPGSTTTSIDETTTTESGFTSTSEGGESTTTSEVVAEITTTTGGATSTTGEAGGGSIPLEGTTTTVDPDGTTTVDPDGTTTVDPDETTTTIAGSGQEGTGGTGSSGTGQDVGGSAQEAGEDTLAYTGAGDISLATLALSLIAAGVLLLVSLRRRSEGD